MLLNLSNKIDSRETHGELRPHGVYRVPFDRSGDPVNSSKWSFASFPLFGQVHTKLAGHCCGGHSASQPAHMAIISRSASCQEPAIRAAQGCPLVTWRPGPSGRTVLCCWEESVSELGISLQRNGRRRPSTLSEPADGCCCCTPRSTTTMALVGNFLPRIPWPCYRY